MKRVVLAFMLLVTSSQGKAQSPAIPLPQMVKSSPDISVTSSLVVFPVRVTDIHGNNVGGLKKEHFRVYEEKRAQPLTLFQEEDTPVSIGLIVDHSASMRTKLPNVITALSALIQSGNPQDDMFVVNFSDRVGKPRITDAAGLREAITTDVPSGRTALYDAIAQGLTQLARSQRQRKALVVISDGGDNASYYKRSEIVALARQSDITIYSVVLVDESGTDQNPGTLLRLSKETAGVAFFPRSASDVIAISLVIARDLREQYVLGYIPEPQDRSGKFQKVQVQVVAPDVGKVRIRTRPGYFAANEDTTSSKRTMDLPLVGRQEAGTQVSQSDLR